MHRRLIGSLCLVCAISSGCFIAKEKQPTVEVAADLATKFVHRGMTLVDRPVVQPSLTVGLPVENGDKIAIAVKGNIDLYNNTGNAWFPDGHAGRFTEFEVIADYSRTFGDVTLTGGLHNYNLPNGQEFQNGERGGTSEVFVKAVLDVLETTPYASWNYDFDEVHASYYRAGISEGFDLGKNFSLLLDGSLGYAGSGQSAWMYGFDQGGFADLRGKAALGWRYDDRTDFELAVNGSSIVNKTLNRWFSQLGIDSDVIWVTAGVTWNF